MATLQGNSYNVELPEYCPDLFLATNQLYEKSMEERAVARSVPFSKTRDHHAKETAEDYVEAVADIIAASGECRVLDLAKHFNVSHVTVSRIVNRLQNEQLLATRPYKPIELTESGAKLAKQVRHRHKILLEFLIAIGVGQKTAEIDSEGMEHHVSKETLSAMKRFLRDNASSNGSPNDSDEPSNKASDE